jgi:hypothetical protein
VLARLDKERLRVAADRVNGDAEFIGDTGEIHPLDHARADLGSFGASSSIHRSRRRRSRFCSSTAVPQAAPLRAVL